MFNLFKKNREWKIRQVTIDNLQKVISHLPNEYAYLKKAINTNLILNEKLNISFGEDWFSFGFNEANFKRYSVSTNSFEIRRIRLQTTDNSIFDMDLFVMNEGIVAGYKLYPFSRLENIKLKNIDLRNIVIHVFKQEELEHIKEKINMIDLDKVVIDFLDIDSMFEIEAFNHRIYALKNLGNGDYICIDDNLKLFICEHDPFKLKKLNVDIRNMDIDNINSFIEN